MEPEGQEMQRAMRYLEPYLEDAFSAGSRVLRTGRFASIQLPLRNHLPVVKIPHVEWQAECAFENEKDVGENVVTRQCSIRGGQCTRTYLSSSSGNQRHRAWFILPPTRTLDDIPALEHLVTATALHGSAGCRDVSLQSQSAHHRRSPRAPRQHQGHAVTAALVRGLITSLKVTPAAATAKEAKFITLFGHVIQPGELATIWWIVSDGHPLRRWLLDHELAVPAHYTARYDHRCAWWVAIYFLQRFCQALTPALNARIARAAISSALAIPGHCTSLRERTAVGSSYALLTVPSPSSPPWQARNRVQPNISLPRGTLVQLTLGYAGWRELKDTTPDVSVEPAVVPLPEVLFPKPSIGSEVFIE
ncbi:hypothetical protein C8R43DRAFT_1136415 [Mycena crocata]|nr:hypothetical protein C8R43DRAFT_1136415 [Mycena crocata]